MARLILDTTVLVSAERRGDSLDGVIDAGDDVAVAAVTAAELLVGVEQADQRRRRDRERWVLTVLDEIPVEDYDISVARSHAQLLAHVRRSGRPRGAHDLIIAATARSCGRTVVTTDPRGFDDLPGIAIRVTG